MYRTDRCHRILLVDEHGHPNFACVDHLDVDIGVIQGLKHLCSHAGGGHHARANNGDLGDLVLHSDVVEVECVLVGLQHPHRFLHIGPRQGKADVLALLPANGLDNRVHVDLRLTQQGEDPECHAWIMIQAHHGDPGYAHILCHARDICLFHLDYLLDFRAGLTLQAGHDFHIYMIFFCQFHAAVVEHLRALAGQLQHLVVGDLIQLFCPRRNPGVGGVHAVHIGKNLAQIRAESGGQRDCAGVRAAPTQGSDVADPVHALEARHNDDLVLIQLPADALGVNPRNACVAVGAGGVEAHLPCGQAHHRQAHALQGHGAQGDGDLLACAQQHIHLPLGGPAVDFAGLFDQFVRCIPLGG